MPGKPKQGVDYAGWSVNIFDGDKKIDKLLDAHGWKGFGVYFFLCQSAYKLNGYFLEWGYDDSATTARRMGGGVTSTTVEETVRFCLLTGLFDKVLFDRWNVLTSKGIQRRFWAVARERRAVPLHKKYWLLPPEEAEGLDKVARFDDLSTTNADSPPMNDHLTPANDYKVKESKVKSLHIHAREEDDDGFTRFWDAYPKKSGDIRGAYMEYLRALDSGAKLPALLLALEWQQEQAAWTENGGQYIPSPEKWLRNHGWEQQKPKPSLPKKKNGMSVSSVPDPDAEKWKLEAMKRMYAKMHKEAENGD